MDAWDNIGDKDSRPRNWRVGLLSALMNRQETYRTMLADLRSAGDQTFAEAMAASHGMDGETLIALAVALFEFAGQDKDEEVIELIWAQEMMDHLDTLGWKLTRK